MKIPTAEEVRASAAARHRRLALEAATPPDELRAEKSKRQNRLTLKAHRRYWAEHSSAEDREMAEALEAQG